MNTTLPSDTLLNRPSQLALASFWALQDLALRFLLHIAKILQHAETWTLSALDAPTHTISRMFPPEDISDYTRVEAQLRALFWLAALVFSHLRGYLGPRPPRDPAYFDNSPWYVRPLFRGCRIFRYLLSYLRIPFVIAHIQVANYLFEADEDVYLLCLRLAPVVLVIAI